MKNFDLIENQPGLVNSTFLFLAEQAVQQGFEGDNIHVLSNITEAGLTHLMQQSKAVKYVKSESIAPNATASTYTIVFFGNVTALNVANGNEASCQIIESNGEFGQIAVLTDELKLTTAFTLANTVFASITITDFNDWLMSQSNLVIDKQPLISKKLDS